MPIALHLRIQVPPGGEPDLVSFLREARPVYEAPGGIRLRLLRSVEDPHRYIELVEYDTAEGCVEDEHRIANDPQVKALLDRWRSLLDGPPCVERYEDVTALLDPVEPTGSDAP